MTSNSALARRTVRSAFALTGFVLLISLSPAYALSARELAEMKQLTPTDRMIQVCFLKLEDRISRETAYRNVDRVMMDAFSRGEIDGRSLRADGAAFRDKGQWFRLRFRCAVTPDRLQVENLHYDVISKTPIPLGEWEKHKLFP